jgi:DNA-binding transcriptional ArsR family regulator
LHRWVVARTRIERKLLSANRFMGNKYITAQRAGTPRLTRCIDITKNMVMRRNYLRAIPREWRMISAAFTALGDAHRQRILLTFEPGERLNVGQIVAVSTLSRSAVSHHLKRLKDAGVLESEKVGKEVFYWVDKAFLEEALQAVLGYIRKRV